jgi:hypothetical protein
VITDGACDEDAIAWAQAAIGDHPRGERDARGRQRDPVELAAAHHLGVAGDDRRARLVACEPDRGPDPLELGAGEAILEDRRAGQRKRLGRAHHREVVDRAAHREPPDVAAGEERRRHDVRVGGDHEEAIAQRDRSAIVHLGQADAARNLAEARREDLLDQRAHRAATGAVLERDAILDETRVAGHARLRICRRSGWPPY